MQAQALETENSFEEVEGTFHRLIERLKANETRNLTHGEVERVLHRDGLELLRQMLQAHLDVRRTAERVRPVVGADGVERLHPRGSHRELETVFGRVVVERLQYQAQGHAGRHPLDGELNLPPEMYSHEVQRRVAREAAKSSFAEVVAVVGETTGAAIPKRQAEAVTVRSAVDFEAFYETRSEDPAATGGSTELMVLTVDGKGVVMRAEDLREATRQAVAGRQPKLAKRLSPGEKRTAKRMATVAAVYQLARQVRHPEEITGTLQQINPPPTPRPQDKRVWASLVKPPEAVIEEVFAEAHGRDPDQVRQWVALVDGNPTQLSLLQTHADRWRINLVIVLDLIHVIEYLWKAAYVFHPPSSEEAQRWVNHRLLKILRGQAGHVAAGMRRSATLRRLPTAERNGVDLCARYLLNHSEFLRYDEYLAAGFPIATGVIEGACRSLVKDRMDLTGARWSLTGAEAVLQLRSLRASGDFDDYWRFHEQQEHMRNHKAHYAGGLVPPQPQPGDTSQVAHLRLVK